MVSGFQNSESSYTIHAKIVLGHDDWSQVYGEVEFDYLNWNHIQLSDPVSE